MGPASNQPITFPKGPFFPLGHPGFRAQEVTPGLQLDLNPEPKGTIKWHHSGAGADQAVRRVASMALLPVGERRQQQQQPQGASSLWAPPTTPQQALAAPSPHHRSRSPSCPTLLPSALRKQPPPLGIAPPKQLTISPFSEHIAGADHAQVSPLAIHLQGLSLADPDSARSSWSSTTLVDSCESVLDAAEYVLKHELLSASPEPVPAPLGTDVHIPELPYGMSAQELYELASPYGEVLAHRVTRASDAAASSGTWDAERNTGFVLFKMPIEASACIRGLLSIGIRGEYGKETYRTMMKKLEDPDARAVYMCNLPPTLNDTDLARLLFPWIPLRCKVLRESCMKAPGRAIVTMQSHKDAQDIVQRFNEFEFPGTANVLEVTFAESAAQKFFKRELQVPQVFQSLQNTPGHHQQLRQFHLAQAHELEKKMIEGQRFRLQSDPAGASNGRTTPTIRPQMAHSLSQNNMRSRFSLPLANSGWAQTQIQPQPAPMSPALPASHKKLHRRSHRDLRHVASPNDLWQGKVESRILWPPADE